MLIIEIYYCIINILLGIYEYIKSFFFRDDRTRKIEILNKYIDKVIYINLEERKDRRESIEILLNKIFNKDKIMRCDAIKDNNGAIGCTKSHIKCLKLAIENEWDNVLIVEDDIDVSKYKSEYIFEKVIKNDYDVINLNGSNFSYNPFTYKLYRCSSAGSYLVNKHYYKKLKNNREEGLEKFVSTNISKKFAHDQYWKKLQAVDNWKIINPPLFIQKESYSNIEKKIVDYQYSIVNCFQNKVLIYIFTYFFVKFIFYFNLNFELFLFLVSIIDMYYVYYHIEKVLIYLLSYLTIKFISYYNLNFGLCILLTFFIDLYTCELNN